MTKTTRLLASAVLLTATLLTARAILAAQIERTIVVHVVDFAQTGTSELARAEEEGSRIYAAVGVQVVWVTGDEETETVDAPALHLKVLILGHERAAQMIEAEQIGDGVLGRAAKAAVTRRQV